jgi:hypothetical protein
MAGKQKFTKEDMIAALHATQGRVFLAAQRLGCSIALSIPFCLPYPSIHQRGR